jgi:lysine-specific histone demethylase 1
MVVTGLGGNPISVLVRQIGMELYKIRQKCPLYDSTGQLVPKNSDDMVEKEFNRLLEATTYLSHELDINHIEGLPVSLGHALELIIKLQERQVKEKQVNHCKQLLALHNQLAETRKQLSEAEQQIRDAHVKYEAAKSIPEPRSFEDEFEYRCWHRDLLAHFKKFDDLIEQQEKLELQVAETESSGPSDVYLTAKDRQILDWHFANLEFANATPLTNLSLKHWDQDDDFEFAGNHLTVRNGYSCLPSSLSEGLDIRLNKAVQKITYNISGRDLPVYNLWLYLKTNICACSFKVQTRFKSTGGGY